METLHFCPSCPYYPWTIGVGGSVVGAVSPETSDVIADDDTVLTFKRQGAVIIVVDWSNWL